MYDAAPGQPYAPTLTFYDAAGSAIESGIVGTMTLYGPGATTALAGPEPLAHLGDGAWGVPWDGATLAAGGLYRAVTSAITGEAEMAAQTVFFTVGLAPAGFRTLRDCIVDLAIELDAGIEGRTTSDGTTTSLIDVGRASVTLGNAEWVDSEILILEPANVADRNPVTVTYFLPASGEFTFTPALANITTEGQDYLLLNLRGRGVGFAKLKRAILAAWHEFGPRQRVTDTVNFATDGSYALAIPAQWRDIETLELRWGPTGPWSEIAPAYWPYDPAAGVVNFARYLGTGQALRVTGYIDAPEPDALTSVVQVPYAWLRDRVLGELLARSDDRGDQQRAAVHLQRADRNRPR